MRAAGRAARDGFTCTTHGSAADGRAAYRASADEYAARNKHVCANGDRDSRAYERADERARHYGQ